MNLPSLFCRHCLPQASDNPPTAAWLRGCVAAWLRALSLRLSLMQIGQVILGQRLSPKQLTEDEIAAITHPVT